jgi:hypothetical protein
MDTPSTEDREGIAELRELLRRVDYEAEGIQRAFGYEGPFARDPLEVPLYVRQLVDDSALSTLIKLYLLDLAVDREEAARAFEPVTLERVEAMGLIRDSGGGIEATVNLFPSGDLFVVADRWNGAEPPRADHVLGLSISSRVLSAHTIRLRFESALDVGTGCGIQALQAAKHADRVVATDVNPRALRFAEFNAALNGHEHVDTRLGSAFEPVEGETFDLVVANPPYVISPETTYAFRDSGLPGDSFSEGLVRRLPDFLNDGGYGQLLVEWAYEPGEDWSLPLRAWLEESGCDAVIVHHRTLQPLEYAASWNQELRGDPDAYGRALDRWVAYDRELGIERIGWGAITLRKRAGDNWVRTLNAPWPSAGPAFHHTLRLFRAQDYLTSLGPGRGLFEGVFVLPEDHRFEQRFAADGGEGRLEGTVLSLEGGLQTKADVDPPMMRVLTLLDGRRTLAEAVDDAVRMTPELGGEAQALAVELLPGFVRLLEVGLIVPAG